MNRLEKINYIHQSLPANQPSVGSFMIQTLSRIWSVSTHPMPSCQKPLEHTGLTILEKRHGEMFEDSRFYNLYNQIWMRK
jgi:hypothetical protein